MLLSEARNEFPAMMVPANSLSCPQRESETSKVAVKLDYGYHGTFPRKAWSYKRKVSNPIPSHATMQHSCQIEFSIMPRAGFSLRKPAAFMYPLEQKHTPLFQKFTWL